MELGKNNLIDELKEDVTSRLSTLPNDIIDHHLHKHLSGSILNNTMQIIDKIFIPFPNSNRVPKMFPRTLVSNEEYLAVLIVNHNSITFKSSCFIYNFQYLIIRIFK